MSYAPQSPTTTRDSTTIDAEQSIQAVLDALDDPDCRDILDVTGDDALTAGELSEECDLALSTAYRKVDELTDAGLLEERTRISSSGSHTSEYARLVEDVHLSLDDCGVSISVSKRESQTPAPRGMMPASSD